MKSVLRSLFYLSLPITTLLAFTPVGKVKAQITTDNTTDTQVIDAGNNTLNIEGNTTNGGNLFHSFREFNVGAGTTANFLQSPEISNIITRVTGGKLSDISGTLGVVGGNANLFLINPAGIVFGENARLNVGGSFFASTADSLLLKDGSEFSASSSALPPSSLLTINTPIGLRFRDNSETITNRSVATDINNNNRTVGLQVQPEKTLALVGGNVNFEGGKIRAPGANVEIGGLKAAGTVGIGSDLSLSFPEGVARSDVSLNDGAFVNVRGGGGGFITINANNLELSGTGTSLRTGIAANMGSPGAKGGDITINSTGSFTLTDGAQISASTFGQGNAGNITLNVDGAVEIFGGTIFNQVGEGAIGNGGTVSINSGSLSLDGGQITASVFGTGDAGNITLDVEKAVTLNNNSDIFSQIGSGAVATGEPSTVKIKAGSLFLNDAGSSISSSTFGNGNAGKIIIDVDGAIQLAERSQIKSIIEAGGEGTAGNINIEGRSLTLRGGSQIASAVVNAEGDILAGKGRGGNIDIKTTDFVDISGVGRNRSGLFASAEEGSAATGERAAGNIKVTTGDFRISDRGLVITSTANSGAGGDININAKTFSATDGALVNASTSGSGNAGDITLDVEKAVILSNNADIFSQIGSGA
nr:filamentous hemagglutinin N-terminal domain-containing protein [Calothrix sp. MO_167.B42]